MTDKEKAAEEYAGNGKVGFPFCGRVAFIAGWDARDPEIAALKKKIKELEDLYEANQ